MSNDQTTNHDAHPHDSERNEALNAIAGKWGKFSRQELAALKTNEDVVSQLVATAAA